MILQHQDSVLATSFGCRIVGDTVLSNYLHARGRMQRWNRRMYTTKSMFTLHSFSPFNFFPFDFFKHWQNGTENSVIANGVAVLTSKVHLWSEKICLFNCAVLGNFFRTADLPVDHRQFCSQNWDYIVCGISSKVRLFYIMHFKAKILFSDLYLLIYILL